MALSLGIQPLPMLWTGRDSRGREDCNNSSALHIFVVWVLGSSGSFCFSKTQVFSGDISALRSRLLLIPSRDRNLPESGPSSLATEIRTMSQIKHLSFKMIEKSLHWMFCWHIKQHMKWKLDIKGWSYFGIEAC